jgi:hypothetical protein
MGVAASSAAPVERTWNITVKQTPETTTITFNHGAIQLADLLASLSVTAPVAAPPVPDGVKPPPVPGGVIVPAQQAEFDELYADFMKEGMTAEDAFLRATVKMESSKFVDLPIFPMHIAKTEEIPDDASIQDEDEFKEEMFVYPKFNDDTDFLDDLKSGELNHTKWIVTEKLHGCHLQFRCNTKTGKVHAYSELGRLHPGDELFEWEKLRYALKKPIRDIANCVKAGGEDVEISVFGEMIGGYLPGYEAASGGPVKRTVYYSPTYEYFVFDIYNHRTGAFYSFNEITGLCTLGGMKHQSEIVRDSTLEEIKDMDIQEMCSTIPDELGIRCAVDDNYIAGVVIRPEYGSYTHPEKGYRGFYHLKSNRLAREVPLELPHDYKPVSATTESMDEELLLYARHVMFQAFSKLIQTIDEQAEAEGEVTFSEQPATAAEISELVSFTLSDILEHTRANKVGDNTLKKIEDELREMIVKYFKDTEIMLPDDVPAPAPAPVTDQDVTEGTTTTDV